MAEGSFAGMMDALENFEQTFAPELAVTRWRPHQVPVGPALWNGQSSEDSTHERRDTALHVDRIELSAYVAVGPGDAASRMESFEHYVDLARAKFDAAFKRSGPLDNTAAKADRRSFALVSIRFNTIELLGAEFPLSIDLHRIIDPS